jgi:hypothetical protein
MMVARAQTDADPAALHLPLLNAFAFLAGTGSMTTEICPSRLLERQAKAVALAGDPWSDERASVEWMVDRMIAKAAREGVSLGEERTLPTAP